MSNDTRWLPLFWQCRLFSDCFPCLQCAGSSLCRAKVGMGPHSVPGCPLDSSPAKASQCCFPTWARPWSSTHTPKTASPEGAHGDSLGLVMPSKAQDLTAPESELTSTLTLWGWDAGYLLWLNMLSLSFHSKWVYWVSSKKIELVATHHSQGDFPPCFSSHASLLPFWFFMETVHLPCCARDSSSSQARLVATLSGFLRTGHTEQGWSKLI